MAEPKTRAMSACANCGEEFWNPPSYQKRGVRHCSRECQHEGTHRSQVCEYCGKEFEFRIQQELNGRHKGRFCSRECSAAYRSDQARMNFNCDECGVEFSRTAGQVAKNKSGYFYCSQQCYRTFTNREGDIRLEIASNEAI